MIVKGDIEISLCGPFICGVVNELELRNLDPQVIAEGL